MGKALRIYQHPIIEVSIPAEKEYVKFLFEGKVIQATVEDTIASALIANGFDIFGLTEHNHPRGFFCAIGKCSACLVEVDGIPNIRACITPVREGMNVRMQTGRGKPVW